MNNQSYQNINNLIKELEIAINTAELNNNEKLDLFKRLNNVQQYLEVPMHNVLSSVKLSTEVLEKIKNNLKNMYTKLS
jgi:hypothetical protein